MLACSSHIEQEGVYNMPDYPRPLDALNEAKNKRVLVLLKNGKEYTGKLKSFDIHVNLVLEEAEELENGEVKKKIGTLFIRGDTITTISPQ